MCRKIAGLTSVLLVFGLLATVSHAQLLGLYEFDGGGDGTSWDDATNWEQKLDPFGAVISGNPALPPGPLTTADIPLAGVVIDGTMAGLTALDVNVGTANGAGSLTMSGGDLTAGSELNIGFDAGGVNGGTFSMTGGTLVADDDIEVGRGSQGIMNMSAGSASAGDDFFIRAGSSLNMTGGTISVGDRLVMEDDGTLSLNGGDIIAFDDFFFFGSSQVTVDSGSMIVKDKLRFDDVLTTGKLTVNGGLVRSQEFGFFDGVSYVMNGTLEINGSGVYQSEQPGVGSPVSQLSVTGAWNRIAAGIITTSEVAPIVLRVQTVIVPDFFGAPNLSFTQISVGEVPEPSSVVLLSLGGLGLLLRRRKRA